EPIGPLAYRRFAVIGLRQDVGQPPHGQLAIVQSLLQAMGPQMPVEDRGQLQLVGQSDDQGNVVNSFVSEGEYLGHMAKPTADFAIRPFDLRESRVLYPLFYPNQHSRGPSGR